MISPDEAWKTEGIPCWALAVPDIVELEEKSRQSAFYRVRFVWDLTPESE